MRIFTINFFVLLISTVSFAQNTKPTTLPAPAKFKTATQLQKEDSLLEKPELFKPIREPRIIRSLDTASWGALVSGGLIFISPQGDLASITNNAFGYGFHVGVLVNLAKRRNPFRWDRKRTNFYIGADFSYLIQGGVKNFASLDDGIYSTTGSSLIFNTFWNTDLVGRFEFLPTQFKLFIEASYGRSVYSGNQYVTLKGIPNNTSSANVEDKFDYKPTTEWLSHYAYGAGFRTGDATLKFEFKLMNYVGESIGYIDINTITISPSSSSTPYTYNTVKTATNFLLPQASMTYLF